MGPNALEVLAQVLHMHHPSAGPQTPADRILGGKPWRVKVSEGHTSAHSPAMLATFSLPAESFPLSDSGTSHHPSGPAFSLALHDHGVPMPGLSCVRAHVLPLPAPLLPAWLRPHSSHTLDLRFSNRPHAIDVFPS